MHATVCTRMGILGLCAAAGAAALVGCADPDAAVGFGEQDPNARLRAIHRATAAKDESAIPDMINALESDDAAERLLAIRGLESMTGQTLGYDHAGSREERAAAVRRWADWYSQRTKTTKRSA